MKRAPFRRVAAVASTAIAFAISLAGGAAWAKIPDVTVVGNSPGLAFAMYPEFYRTIDDAAAADSTFRSATIIETEVFWEKHGKQILTLVSDLSGLPWKEKSFPLYLVEEAPSWGISDPLVYPIQYWRRGDLVRMAPVGDARAFVMAYLLAQRIFLQLPDGKGPEVLKHPLFERGLGTRDVMANLVAYWTTVEIFGEKPAIDFVKNSGFMLESPGLNLISSKFLPGWRLSKKKPLVQWVKEEPVDSDLVKEAKGFRASLGIPALEGRKPGTPDRGLIGLRPRITPDGDVVVWAVEPGKLAEKAELQPGDIFVRVGGVTVTNSRDVMLRMVGVLKNDEAVPIEVERDGHLIDTWINRRWLKKGDG